MTSPTIESIDLPLFGDRRLSRREIDTGIDLLRSPEKRTYRMIETVSINDSVISVNVKKELHVAKSDRRFARRFPNQVMRQVYPLMTRDKDTLVDNLSVDAPVNTAVLPRAICVKIAEYILRSAWGHVKQEFASLPDSLLPSILAIPNSSVNLSDLYFLNFIDRLTDAIGTEAILGPACVDLIGWMRFFARSHVLWGLVQNKANVDGRVTLEYSFQAPYEAERRRDDKPGLRRLSRNQVRIATQGPFSAQSYHFRMVAPLTRRFLRQRIVGIVSTGVQDTIVRGPDHRPYSHLYTQHVQRNEYEGALIQLRLVESRPWSSSTTAAIALASLLSIVSLIVTAPRSSASLSGAATLMLSLPAAAAFWLGAPTTHALLASLPRRSRFFLTLTGSLAIASGLLATQFGPVSSFSPTIELKDVDWALSGLVVIATLQFAVVVSCASVSAKLRSFEKAANL